MHACVRFFECKSSTFFWGWYACSRALERKMLGQHVFPLTACGNEILEEDKTDIEESKRNVVMNAWLSQACLITIN